MLSAFAGLTGVLGLLNGCKAGSESPAHLGVISQTQQPEPEKWETRNHGQGYCAMYGICGDRLDGGSLNCPCNIPAKEAEPDAQRILSTICPQFWAESGGHVCCSGDQAGVMQREMSKAEPFIIGCPACMNNFRNLFCSLFCSPNQASFTNVTAVDTGSPQSNRSEEVVVVKEVAFYLSESFKNATYDSCKDVSFGSANSRAMTYIGNGATTAQEFLDFIGTVKDKTVYHIGSPIQLDFMPGDVDVPDEITPYEQSLPTCWDSLLRCSCGDCPDAPTCAPPDAGGPNTSAHACTITHILGFPVWCTDGFSLLVGLVLLGILGWLSSHGRLELKAGSQPIAMVSERSWLDARTPEREVSMGASVDEERSAGETLLPPLAVPYFHAPSDDSWVSLAGRPAPSVQAWLQRFFAFLGRRVTGSPGWTILICIACVACCMLGLIGMRIVTDPVHLWVPKTSRAAKDKAAFDSEFGPFYRIEQIILSTKPNAEGSRPPILSKQAIELVFDIHDVIDEVRAVSFEGDVLYLGDVCYKPFGDACATQSIAQFWAMSRHDFQSGFPSLNYCLSHWSTACRSAFKAPLDPKLVLGGYPENSTDLMADTTALLITLPVSNNQSTLHKTKQWERHFSRAVEEKIVPMVATHGLDISWTAEISVQTELERESLLDAPTVALSYAAMLTYIALALGRGPWDFSSPWTKRVVESRALLAVAGVAIVVCAVLGGMGICSTLGVSASLIVMEVVPFLALAIGVDNMFLLATEEALQPHSVPVRERVARALVAVGPSITLSTLCEVLAFLAAALTSVPAVRNFALVAAAAIVLDFCLQITAFVAVLVLDCERMRDGYADVLPFICLLPEESVTDSEAFEVEQLSEGELPEPDILGAESVGPGREAPGNEPSGAHALLSHGLGALHERLLSKPRGKMAILCIAVIASTAAVISISHVSIGLDQQVALPQDSHLQQYFRDVLEFARVGPPVYFVVENMNVSASSPDTVAVCGSAACSDDSLVNIVSQAARHPAETYIATPAASWIDDFVSWVQPELPNCCRQHGEGAFCPAPDVEPCKSDSDVCSDCQPCLYPADLDKGRPTLSDFQRLLPWFLKATPSQSCAKGGRGVYNAAFKMDPHTEEPAGLSEGLVTSSFRAMSQPLSRQSDFIAALVSSRRLADQIQRSLDAAEGRSGRAPFVYVYSVFHPFFEQFLTIVWDSVTLLSLSSVLVLLVALAFTGSLHLSGILALTIGSLMLDVMGAMHVSGVQLNAVSLVNIAMCAGIGLEFLSHTAHAFLTATGSREQRVNIALRGKGAAVCSGIILTKLVGVVMLAFSQTKIFELYYFRMYMALVVIGSFHGLLLLPVLLELVGPEAKASVGPILHRQSTDSGNYEQIFTSRARCIISRKDASATSSSSTLGDHVFG